MRILISIGAARREQPPHMVMIERSGRIAFVHTGYSEAMLDVLIEEINELLADPVPAG